MEINQITVKVYLLKDIYKNEVHLRIAELIDKTLCREEKFYKFHEENKFKMYSFNYLYPLEKSGIYKAGNLYSFTFRTVDKELLQYIKKYLVNEYTEYLKVLTIEEKIIPQKHIEKIYCITPLVIKTEKGYWKGNISLEDFERRIKENLIKKYNQYFNTKINEDFKLYNNIIFDNEKPISIDYKGIKLLGDKITLFIGNDEMSQKLAQFALGVSLGELGSRGMGFVNYKWL